METLLLMSKEGSLRILAVFFFLNKKLHSIKIIKRNPRIGDASSVEAFASTSCLQDEGDGKAEIGCVGQMKAFFTSAVRICWWLWPGNGN